MNTQAYGYRGIQIGLHWLIAVLVLVQLVFGESMTAYVDAVGEGRPLTSLEATLGSVHYWVGMAVLALVIVRLGVRLYYGAPPIDVTTPRWMKLASVPPMSPSTLCWRRCRSRVCWPSMSGTGWATSMPGPSRCSSCSLGFMRLRRCSTNLC